MFDFPNLKAFPPQLVCCADTSVLITFKRLVRIEEQWDLLMQMSELVRDGFITFPRQVANELVQVQFPDAPGAWISNAKHLVCHPQPSEESLVKVLQVAEQLVDVEATKEREVADPYVAAMAYEIAAHYRDCRVIVATDDRVDRLPAKLSLVTACNRLGLENWTADEFIDWVRSHPPGSPGPESSP